MTYQNNELRALNDHEIDDVNGGIITTIAIATLVVVSVTLVVAIFESGRNAGADAAERDNRADERRRAG
jgi:lactobin A/cerein 7B family class IIb bacteriocin